MATTTYINGNFETLAAAMQQLVTMGYFSSVEYDDSGTYPAVVCKDADENAVLTIGKASTGNSVTVTFRLDEGTAKSVTMTQTGSTPYYLYVCSGGAYLALGTSASTNFMGCIIAKTNRDKIGCITLGDIQQNGSRYGIVRSMAVDDDPVQIGTNFAFGLPTTRNQTTLMNIPTCSAANVVSYFPDVYYTFTSQYSYTNNTATPPQNFTQDGKRYLWIGYYAIRDEEES